MFTVAKILLPTQYAICIRFDVGLIKDFTKPSRNCPDNTNVNYVILPT